MDVNGLLTCLDEQTLIQIYRVDPGGSVHPLSLHHPAGETSANNQDGALRQTRASPRRSTVVVRDESMPPGHDDVAGLRLVERLSRPLRSGAVAPDHVIAMDDAVRAGAAGITSRRRSGPHRRGQARGAVRAAELDDRRRDPAPRLVARGARSATASGCLRRRALSR
jgi:hypothetical protein